MEYIKLKLRGNAMATPRTPRTPRIYRYTFSTGRELVTVDAENLDSALLIIKAEYGCYLVVKRMDRI